MCYCSTHIAKIVIKLTIESNLFKNGCLFIHSIQQNKIYWPIAAKFMQGKNYCCFFKILLDTITVLLIQFFSFDELQ